MILTSQSLIAAAIERIQEKDPVFALVEKICQQSSHLIRRFILGKYENGQILFFDGKQSFVQEKRIYKDSGDWALGDQKTITQYPVVIPDFVLAGQANDSFSYFVLISETVRRGNSHFLHKLAGLSWMVKNPLEESEVMIPDELIQKREEKSFFESLFPLGIL